MNDNAKRWFAFAQEDLQVAETIFKEDIYNQVCFHAQQCVEKVLKGLLANQELVPPRTHSITDLLRLLPANLFFDWRNALTDLDDYYIPTRYPDAIPGSLPYGLPGKKQAEETLSLARRTFEEAKKLL